MSHYVYVGLYGTSLSPIITQLMHIGDLPVAARFFLALTAGITIGFLLPPLAAQVHHAHQGYSLYNVGFAGGIIATVIVSLLKSFGVTVESLSDLVHRKRFPVFLTISINPFSRHGRGSLLLSEGAAWWRNIRKFFTAPATAVSDYLRDNGGPATVLNMAVNGFMATLLVLIAGGDLNGPTIGGIFYYCGIQLHWKTRPQYISHHGGRVSGRAYQAVEYQRSVADVSVSLFHHAGSHLRRIWLAGRTGGRFPPLLGGLKRGNCIWGEMNLYNNGFAGGMVAIFMVPVIQSVRDRRARAKEEEALE